MTSTSRIPQQCHTLTDIKGDEIIINAAEETATKEINSDIDILPKSDESNGTRTTSTEIINDDKSNSDINNDNTTTRWYCSLKLYVGLLLVGLIIYVIIDSVTNKYVRDGLVTFLDWVEENTLSGFFLFVIGTFPLSLHQYCTMSSIECYNP